MSNLPPQGPRTEPPRTRGAPVVLPTGIAQGRPASFRPGAPAAYYIWQGPRGGWRVKTTTQNATHTFRGHVHGQTGPVGNLHPSRTELHDRIWKTKQGWSFSFVTDGHADGFTFITRDNGCVVFDLQLDGGPQPKRVIIGSSEHQPPGGFFVLCPQGAAPR